MLQWLPSTLKIKSKLFMMLSTGYLIWLLINYCIPSPLCFSHSCLCESSSNSRSTRPLAFASLCLNTSPQIYASLALKVPSNLCLNVTSLRRLMALPNDPNLTASCHFLTCLIFLPSTCPNLMSQHGFMFYIGITWFLATPSRM